MSSEAIMESDSQHAPQTKPKLFCFVLMPFSPDFDDVYQIGIKEACESAGAYCERVDEQIFSERILDRIYNQIAKADVVIADMTGRNANVFYEVGYAHALGKPTILLTRNADDIPFDLKHFPHIVYEAKLGVLRDQLTRRVAWHIEHPSSGIEDTKFPFEIYVNGANANSINLLVHTGQDKTVSLKILVGNKSFHPISESDFKLVIVTNSQFNRVILSNMNSVPMVNLPDGKRQFILPGFGDLMSTEYNDISVRVYNSTTGALVTFPDEMTLRLMSIFGNKDFPVRVEKIEDNKI